MALFESLEEALQNPAEVTELELFGHDLFDQDLEVSADIIQLTNLQSLEICQFRNLTLPNELADLPQLSHLVLEECQYDVIPEVVWRCRKLTSLTLDPDQSREIPPDIGHLRHLKSLTTWGVRYLPDTLALCHHLEHLDLSYCEFPTLPRSVGELHKLKRLDLSRTPLEELPLWLMQLPLEVLYWEGSHPNMSQHRTQPRIQQIRESWCGLTELRELYLSYQHIIDVSANVRKLTNLVRLDLSYNGLDELPEEIGTIPNLQELYLSGNQLTHLPTSLAQCQSLKFLALDGNPICSVEELCGWWPQLEELHLFNTKVDPAHRLVLQAQFPNIRFRFTWDDD